MDAIRAQKGVVKVVSYYCCWYKCIIDEIPICYYNTKISLYQRNNKKGKCVNLHLKIKKMKKTNQLFFGLVAIAAVACATTREAAVEMTEDESVSIASESTTSTEEPATSTSSDPADTVVIGTQVWMTQNVSTIVFQNGDTIIEARTNEEWVNAAKNRIPAWCYHDKAGENKSYGKMYNYWAVTDSRGLAPKGWRIPSVDDFETLTNEIGGAGSSALKSTSGWEEGGNGTNESGFNALPSGYRNATGLFNPIGRLSAWWSTNEKSSGSAFGYVVRADDNVFVKDEYYKRSGLYVRCLR